MKVRELSKPEFTRALNNGLGCALLHVKEYGDKGLEEEILEACLTNMVYFRQINCSRGEWLAHVLDHTEHIEEYARQINEALTRGPEDGANFSQLVELASELFERGFYEFKPTLISLPPDEKNEETLTLGEALVNVAGFTGLEMAARRMVHSSAESWKMECLYRYACEKFDSENDVTDFFEDRVDHDPALARFWKELQEEIATSLKRSEDHTPLPTLDLNQVLAMIATDPKTTSSLKLARFGRKALDEDLQVLVRNLSQEQDPARIYAYLTVFRDRALPEVPDNVLALVRGEDKDLARVARNALSIVKSDEVRELGLNALQSESEDHIISGIYLLTLNYQPNDREKISNALRNLKDRDSIHWGGMATFAIADNSDDKDLTELFVWLYDWTPCSNCRMLVLNHLTRWGTAPAQLLYEAQWDVEEQVRHIARASILTLKSTRS